MFRQVRPRSVAGERGGLPDVFLGCFRGTAETLPDLLRRPLYHGQDVAADDGNRVPKRLTRCGRGVPMLAERFQRYDMHSAPQERIHPLPHLADAAQVVVHDQQPTFLRRRFRPDRPGRDDAVTRLGQRREEVPLDVAKFGKDREDVAKRNLPLQQDQASSLYASRRMTTHAGIRS